MKAWVLTYGEPRLITAKALATILLRSTFLMLFSFLPRFICLSKYCRYSEQVERLQVTALDKSAFIFLLALWDTLDLE